MAKTTPLATLLLLLVIITASPWARAQNGGSSDGTVNAKFASQNQEISVVCGEFLPNDITGVTEMMSLCGGRYAMRLAKNLMFEPEFLGGAAHAQHYFLGSASFRGDFQLEDFVTSFYAGADIHYATSPIYNAGVVTDTSTHIYVGGHIGAAVWVGITDNLNFRGDLKFLLNPGTSLFVGASLVWRFGSGGGGS